MSARQSLMRSAAALRVLKRRPVRLMIALGAGGFAKIFPRCRFVDLSLTSIRLFPRLSRGSGGRPWPRFAVECVAAFDSSRTFISKTLSSDGPGGRCGHRALPGREHRFPHSTEWLIGGDPHRAPLVSYFAITRTTPLVSAVIRADRRRCHRGSARMEITCLACRSHFRGPSSRRRDLKALERDRSAHEQHAPPFSRREPDGYLE